jgi:hypothetical protein
LPASDIRAAMHPPMQPKGDFGANPRRTASIMIRTRHLLLEKSGHPINWVSPCCCSLCMTCFSGHKAGTHGQRAWRRPSRWRGGPSWARTPQGRTRWRSQQGQGERRSCAFCKDGKKSSSIFRVHSPRFATPPFPFLSKFWLQQRRGGKEVFAFEFENLCKNLKIRRARRR